MIRVENLKVIEDPDSTIPDLKFIKPSRQLLPVIAPFTDVPHLLSRSSLVSPPQSTLKLQQSPQSLPEITPFIAFHAKIGKDWTRMRKQDSTYTIRSTDKVPLKNNDLKQSSHFKHMNKNKTANRNTANYHLYHAQMEALIADEDVMDKEVTVKVKDHKRKHDSDDDEGPSAGSNQGKSAKRRRHDSGASRSAQPPTKYDEQSLKKPRKSDASASKQHPALPSTGWKIIDTRDANVDSSMHMSDPESEQSEQSSDNIPMQDERHVSDLEDTDNVHIPKDSHSGALNDLSVTPENNWANTYATTYQVPTENKLQRKTYDIGLFIKWFCRRTGKKKLCKADLEDVDSEHFDRDDNTGDDNEENKPDPEEIYK
ncbi:hypothetical protein Tco_0180300 [Tanacetum coccineum]